MLTTSAFETLHRPSLYKSFRLLCKVLEKKPISATGVRSVLYVPHLYRKVYDKLDPKIIPSSLLKVMIYLKLGEINKSVVSVIDPMSRKNWKLMN